MKALEIAEKVREAILSSKFHQVLVNLPNGDMMGHTGDVEATVVACKAADDAVKVATWSRHTAKVNQLILFGEHIVSVDVDGNIFVWAFKGIDQNHAPIGHILLEDKFSPTCIMHPDTYLNKILPGHP